MSFMGRQSISKSQFPSLSEMASQKSFIMLDGSSSSEAHRKKFMKTPAELDRKIEELKGEPCNKEYRSFSNSSLASNKSYRDYRYSSPRRKKEARANSMNDMKQKSNENIPLKNGKEILCHSGPDNARDRNASLQLPKNLNFFDLCKLQKRKFTKDAKESSKNQEKPDEEEEANQFLR